MNYTEKYKEGFYKRIEKELNQCEIIYNPNTKGIWFVNRERKYWFLEYKIETNYLWWRYDYFKKITSLIAMTSEVFQKLISEWVENKLNGKVDTIDKSCYDGGKMVEDTLNCKVVTTSYNNTKFSGRVEETLNCKVESTTLSYFIKLFLVEETLNCKVDSTWSLLDDCEDEVEDTLN